MEDCLNVSGKNGFKTRHMNKAPLQKEGKYLVSIKNDPALIARGHEIVDDPEWLAREEVIMQQRKIDALRARQNMIFLNKWGRDWTPPPSPDSNATCDPSDGEDDE